jgi:hypothetical protein
LVVVLAVIDAAHGRLAGYATSVAAHRHEGEPMADHTELHAEVQRELTAIRVETERLAGRVRALETIVERYGADDEKG